MFFDTLNAPGLPAYFEADQLYDLALDPLEQVNLIDDPTRAAVAEDLREELFAITRTLPCPFPRSADPFLQTKEYKDLLATRYAEMAKIQHYPTKASHYPATWYGNYADPDIQ